MITVSDEFKALWEQKLGTRHELRIRYKRRYKLGSTYYQESDWQLLPMSEFVKVGNIPHDTDGNIIKTSVMTLQLPNEHNQFIEHPGSPSFWASDTVAVDGYKAVRTLWQVQEGYKLSDGTTEWISVFTGIQMSKPRITGKGSVALIDVSSKAVLLERADAEEVRDTDVTLENCVPATGDNSRTEFESTSTGVDHASDLQVNAVTKEQGSEWRVDNANEVASAGNTGRLAITLSAAPASGQTVKVSLQKWLQNQRVETVLGLLADEAGIPSSERSIATVVFPGSLSGSKSLDSSAEWADVDEKTMIDVATLTGAIRPRWFTIDDFSDGDFTSNPAWATSGGGTAGWSISSGKLRGNSTSEELRLTVTGHSAHGSMDGTWEVQIDRTSGLPKFYLKTGNFFFPGGGYADKGKLWLEVDGVVVYVKYGGASAVETLTSVAHTPAAGDIYRVILNNGTVQIRVFNSSWVLQASASASGKEYGRTSIGAIGCYNGTGDATFDNIKFSYDFVEDDRSDQPLVLEKEWDLLSAPTAWGPFESVETASGWTIAYALKVSADGTTYGAYEAVTGGVVTNDLEQWATLKVTFTAPATLGSIEYPQVDEAVLNFETSTIFVSLANHRGKTVMQAMEDYIKLPDYEMRFRGDGTMVIGPKSSGAYVVHLTQESGILDVLEVDYGVPARVVRFGRVRYQGFVSVYGDAEAGASAETIADGDEIGKGGVDEDLDRVLVANDLNLGSSRARVLYENRRRSATDPYPPVRLRLMIWDVPWLEQGDVVRISYFDHPLLAALQANDELLRADGPYAHAGNPGNVVSNAKDWRLLYYNPNKDTGIAEVLVEEVL